MSRDARARERAPRVRERARGSAARARRMACSPGRERRRRRLMLANVTNQPCFSIQYCCRGTYYWGGLSLGVTRCPKHKRCVCPLVLLVHWCMVANAQVVVPQTRCTSKSHPEPTVQPPLSSTVVQSLAPAAWQMASASAKVLSPAHCQPASDSPHTEQPFRRDPQAADSLTSEQHRTSCGSSGSLSPAASEQ